MSYTQPEGVQEKHFKNCLHFGVEHFCIPMNYKQCNGCRSACCPNILQPFSFFRETPGPDEVLCPDCIDGYMKRLKGMQSNRQPSINSSAVASHTLGSPTNDTGSVPAPKSPEGRETISFDSTNSSVAESDGDASLNQGVAKLTLSETIKRRKLTPTNSSGEHEPASPSAPTGPDTVAPEEGDSAMINSTHPDNNIDMGPLSTTPASGDVVMTATGSKDEDPGKLRVDLEEDYDPREPKDPEQSSSAPMEVSAEPVVTPAEAKPPKPKKFRFLWRVHPDTPANQRFKDNVPMSEFTGTREDYETMYTLIDQKHNHNKQPIILSPIRATTNFEFIPDFTERVVSNGTVTDGTEELKSLVALAPSRRPPKPNHEYTGRKLDLWAVSYQDKFLNMRFYTDWDFVIYYVYFPVAAQQYAHAISVGSVQLTKHMFHMLP